LKPCRWGCGQVQQQQAGRLAADQRCNGRHLDRVRHRLGQGHQAASHLRTAATTDPPLMVTTGLLSRDRNRLRWNPTHRHRNQLMFMGHRHHPAMVHLQQAMAILHHPMVTACRLHLAPTHRHLGPIHIPVATRCLILVPIHHQLHMALLHPCTDTLRHMAIPLRCLTHIALDRSRGADPAAGLHGRRASTRVGSSLALTMMTTFG